MLPLLLELTFLHRYKPISNMFLLVWFKTLVAGHINKWLNWFKLNLQLFMCRTEALLKLHQIDDAESSLSNIPKLEPSTTSCSQSRFFGMLSEAYLYFVGAQIEMALGR